MVDIAVSYTNTNIVGRGLGLAFTSESDATYLYFKTIAESRVAKDLPASMGTTMKSHCTMLMICHLWMGASPETGMRSFSSGDFSGSQDAGETIYLKEYRQIIDVFQADASASDVNKVTRSDASMGEFKLDQVDLPTYFRS